MDNLASHKSYLIISLLKEYNLTNFNVLMTSSNTPEFNPIENLFGFVKRKLRDMVIKNDIHLANFVIKTMF